MKERFKFRVWNGKEMLYKGGLGYDGNQLIEDKGHIIMQCTGLKDKNGNLIFEGDIVRAKYYPFYRKEDGKYNYYAEICWDKESASFFYYTFCISKDVQGISTGNTGEISEYKWEIIGNIYENKELEKQEPTLEETVFWIEWIVRKQIMRTISLQKVIEEFLWFSDRWCLAEQLTADILFAGSVGGFNDIPEQLDYIKRFCSE